MAEKKIKYLGVRIPEDIWKDIHDIAEYNGHPVSYVVRRLLEDALKRFDVEEEEIYETISRL